MRLRWTHQRRAHPGLPAAHTKNGIPTGYAGGSMGQRRARPIQNQNPSEVAIEIYEEGKETPVEVLRQPAPNGFPPDLLHHLADFMARGFNAALRVADRAISFYDFVNREARPRE